MATVLKSITAMKEYDDKSVEELRHEYYVMSHSDQKRMRDSVLQIFILFE